MHNKESEDIHSNSFAASLRIKNCPELHEELSKIIKPTHCHKKGDIRVGKKKWDNNIWILDSPLDKHLPYAEHINWIWHKIKPHKEYIKDLLIRDVEIDLFCCFTSEYDQAGFILDESIYEMLCELKIPIELSIVVI